MQSTVLASSYSKSVRPSVCLSVTRWHCVKTTQATIMGSTVAEFGDIASVDRAFRSETLLFRCGGEETAFDDTVTTADTGR